MDLWLASPPVESWESEVSRGFGAACSMGRRFTYLDPYASRKKGWQPGACSLVLKPGSLPLLATLPNHARRAVGRIPVGIAAGAVLAFTSAMVDVSGQKLRADGYVDDGATPGRTVYPYDA